MGEGKPLLILSLKKVELMAAEDVTDDKAKRDETLED